MSAPQDTPPADTAPAGEDQLALAVEPSMTVQVEESRPGGLALHTFGPHQLSVARDLVRLLLGHQEPPKGDGPWATAVAGGRMRVSLLPDA